MRLHGWFLPAVWPLSLCGRVNGAEWGRGREIQAFTAFVGLVSGGWQGRGERTAARPSARMVSGAWQVFNGV